jgi:hypothetical protein
MTDGELPEGLRRELFRAIVEEQDKGGPPGRARAVAARRFGVSDREARSVESEGLTWGWPPLEEG